MNASILNIFLSILMLTSVCTTGAIAQNQNVDRGNTTEIRCTTETANHYSRTAHTPTHRMFFMHDVPQITVYGDVKWVRPEYEFSRTSENTVTVRAQFNFSKNLIGHNDSIVINSRFFNNNPGISLQQQEGFNRDEERFVWDGNTNPATIKYSVQVGEEHRVGNGLLVRDITIPQRSIFSDDDYMSISVLSSKFSVENGYRTVGGSLYLGEYAEYERTNRNETIRIIVPEEINIDDQEIDTVLARLSNVSNNTHIGVRHSTVEFLVVPTENLEGEKYSNIIGRAYGANQNVGRWSSRSSALIGDTAVNSSSNSNVWTHEYIHTRQEFITGPIRHSKINWIDEGSAEYYDILLAYELGKIDYPQFHRQVTATQGTGNEVLGKPGSWIDRSAPYKKGSLVLAALDAKIRQATNGSKSLQSVLWRMNANANPRFTNRSAANSELGEPEDGIIWTNYARFKEIVAVVSGENLDEWLDKYILTSATPTVPQNESLYESPQYTDSDRDGIPDRIETEIGTDPTDSDTDNDTIGDGSEMFYCLTDPASKDTDGDQIPDNEELLNKTSPILSDTDIDTFDDYEEIKNGTDPRDKGDYPESTSTQDSTPGFGPSIVVISFLVVILILSRFRRLE